MVFIDVKTPRTECRSILKKKKGAVEPEPEARENWGSKAEFLLSCIGLAVGIGNVWRFPYLAYQNGGGAFLVAYVILLVFVGKPHFFAELALGQFTGQGALRVWKCLPIAKGMGFAMIFLSGMIAIYYNVIMAYTLYFIGQSFRSELPWATCQEWWGADSNCYVRKPNQTSCREVSKNLAEKYSVPPDFIMDDSSGLVNLTYKDTLYVVPSEVYAQAFNSCITGSQTASEQFWERYVLQLTPGIEQMGGIKWDLAITLFVCWMLVALGLMNGIRSSGKVVYFTATFPYVILVALVIYGCTLPGASEGLKYLFIPDWSKLLTISVWRAAAEQMFYSLSLGAGCLIMYASYNPFDNKLYRDAIFVSSLDFITSVMSGVVIFSVLGNMATEMSLDIETVAKGGQGLAFVTYPEALARLPVPQLWSVLFFFMLFLLAIDSEFSYIENIYTVLYDAYPHLKKKKKIITIGSCFVFFLCGLPCVMQGGQYVLNLMDSYGGGYATIFIATLELSALMWGYGSENLADDIHFMLGFKLSLYWRICWRYIAPTTLWFLLIYSLATHSTLKYAEKEYPLWAECVGWLLVMVSVLQVPVWGSLQIYRYRKDWRKLFTPHPDWGPTDPAARHLYELRKSKAPTTTITPPTEGVDNLAMDHVVDR